MEKKRSRMVLICGIAVCILSLSDPPAFGQALAGFLWAENIGWISLSCENTASCAKVNFGVKKAGKGKLTGFAWGENIGWVNFAPSGGGGVALDPATGQLSGQVWSKNVGWIRLRGTLVPNYGVDVDGGKVVNGKFPPLGSGNVRTGFSLSPCSAAGPAGTFIIVATFKNTSADTISRPFFKVRSLTGGNVLCNADGGPGGPGATLTVPLIDNSVKRKLYPGELFNIRFDIGLKTQAQFTFLVDILDDPDSFAWGENIGWLNAKPSGRGGPGLRMNP
ncbi:MAG: hypothetical protein MRJ67_00590 [Nitrospirales bacterium]|nr:hypothetical protein [Nitrospira sp.]MDR4459014.1 hypothetical protein [Nitrospirales bacterium]MDR4483608.1 hypothetical protein [Nitrospirales bacterium]